jgi:excisionase family DNA binding protein
MNLPSLMGTAEASRLLGIPDRRLRELLADGILSGLKIDRKWLITIQALQRFEARK